jgi:predicted metal-dependent hydrolase
MQQFELQEVGVVTVKKSSRAKRLILKITPDGQPVVTIPTGVPFALGVRFARQHAAWFIKNLPATSKVRLYSGKPIGQTHTLKFKVADVVKPTSRVQDTVIVVSYPPELNPSNRAVQSAAKQAAIRALKKQGDKYLPSWLHALAEENNYKYKGVSVKKMKSRWGSCSSDNHIALSIWLMQLPDDLIEYVLCHELAHINQKHHQTGFWQELATMVPDYKERRKALRTYQPALM